MLGYFAPGRNHSDSRCLLNCLFFIRTVTGSSLSFSLSLSLFLSFPKWLLFNHWKQVKWSIHNRQKNTSLAFAKGPGAERVFSLSPNWSPTSKDAHSGSRGLSQERGAGICPSCGLGSSGPHLLQASIRRAPVTSLVMTWGNVINLQNRTAVSTAVFVTSQPMATKLCHVLWGSCPTRSHSCPGEVGPKAGRQGAISTTPVYKNDVEKKTK